MMTEEEKKKCKKLGITARKYGGDDSCSWAVMHNGRVVVSGLNKRSVNYYKAEVLKMLSK